MENSSTIGLESPQECLDAQNQEFCKEIPSQERFLMRMVNTGEIKEFSEMECIKLIIEQKAECAF